MIGTWLRDRKQKRWERVYLRGYEFAAGQLLSGDETPHVNRRVPLFR